MAESEAGTSKKGSFDVTFKLKVVEAAEKSTNRVAAETFAVNEVNVWYWRKQKQQLQTIPGKERLPGRGRKASFRDMEENLTL